jgi:hypothetical protein
MRRSRETIEPDPRVALVGRSTDDRDEAGLCAAGRTNLGLKSKTRLPRNGRVRFDIFRNAGSMRAVASRTRGVGRIEY